MNTYIKSVVEDKNNASSLEINNDGVVSIVVRKKGEVNDVENN